MSASSLFAAFAVIVTAVFGVAMTVLTPVSFGKFIVWVTGG